MSTDVTFPLSSPALGNGLQVKIKASHFTLFDFMRFRQISESSAFVHRYKPKNPRPICCSFIPKLGVLQTECSCLWNHFKGTGLSWPIKDDIDLLQMKSSALRNSKVVKFYS